MNFLLILAFLSLWIVIGNKEREPNWRLALVQAGIMWGGFLVLGTELLGFFRIINRLSHSVMWTIPILFGVIWIWLRLKNGKILRLPIIYHRDTWVGVGLDLFVILILVITALVAIISPPNSSDAMVTQMSRVAQWGQNQNLSHFATQIESQNSRAPGADMMILNFFVLGQNDRLVNLVAWLSFAGIIASSASLAEVFGASNKGQRLAAIFSATLPGAIVLATGTMNTIVVSFWILSGVLMTIHYIKKSPQRIYLFTAGIAAGLALLTKTTSFIVLWSFGLYLIIAIKQRVGIRKMILWALTAIALISLLNAGYIQRNLQSYGQLLRRADFQEPMNEVRSWRVIVSNSLRNSALHIPQALGLDQFVHGKIEAVHDWVGLDISDPRTTSGPGFEIPQANTSELTSKNSVHSLVMVVGFAIFVIRMINGKKDADLIPLFGVIILSFILLSHFMKWEITGASLQLPLFILAAGLIGVLFDRLSNQTLNMIIAVILLVGSIPWLLQTQERPVIPDQQHTHPVSVFRADRETLYFVHQPDHYPAYREISKIITERRIQEVGLHLTATSKEYPFWALLGAPKDDPMIAWVSADPASEKHLQADFSPGAIICEACSQSDIENYLANYERMTIQPFDLFIKEN